MALQYNIDDGPTFTGLNSVIAYYSEQPDGLTRSLKQFCPIEDLAPSTRKSDGHRSDKAEVPPGPQRGEGHTTAGADVGGRANQSHITNIPWEQLVEGEAIGSGNFGDVKQGVWNKPGCPGIPVALKTVRDANQSSAATKEFLLEASDMVQLNNPLVTVVGVLGIGAILQFLVKTLLAWFV